MFNIDSKITFVVGREVLETVLCPADFITVLNDRLAGIAEGKYAGSKLSKFYSWPTELQLTDYVDSNILPKKNIPGAEEVQRKQGDRITSSLRKV